MLIEDILFQLKDKLAPENFKIQPQSSKEELLRLESTHQINTTDFLHCKNIKRTLSVEICDEWINQLSTFFLFGGSLSEINHIKARK